MSACTSSFQLAHRGRHGDRMRDIDLAAVAQLTQVRGVGIAVGLAHLLNAGTVEIVELFQQRGVWLAAAALATAADASPDAATWPANRLQLPC